MAFPLTVLLPRSKVLRVPTDAPLWTMCSALNGKIRYVQALAAD
jgi:hypothetical protein